MAEDVAKHGLDPEPWMPAVAALHPAAQGTDGEGAQGQASGVAHGETAETTTGPEGAPGAASTGLERRAGRGDQAQPVDRANEPSEVEAHA